MKFIIGKKIEMTQIWRNDEVLAVTKVQAGPCTVVQVKDMKKDGYEAVQVGFGEKKEKNTKKPQRGHFKGMNNFRYLKEFRTEIGSLKKGDQINVDTFEPENIVDVIGTTKGKGFQGVVKRYGFSGQIKTHGTKDQVRMPGSVGATGPAHVFKGTRMGGRMGGDKMTAKNLEIVEIDNENSLIYIKGAVPGARNSFVMIKGEGELKVSEAKLKKIEEAKDEKIEEKKEEKTIDSNKEEKKEVEAKQEEGAKEEGAEKK